MWQAIANAEIQDRALETIAEIAACLRSLGDGPGSGNEHPLLAGGASGLALFWAYLDAARPGTDAGERAVTTLETCLEETARMDLIPSLFSGFCGVGWVIEHLCRRFIASEEDLAAELDLVLDSLLRGRSKVQPYELVGGLAGVGTYLVERLGRPGADERLALVLDGLEEGAEVNAAGCTWLTRPEWLAPFRRQRMPEGHYNLGVAHGVPGVLGLLAAAKGAGFNDERLTPLAEGTVAWLLTQRGPAGEISVYPSTLLPDGSTEPTRTAWCYGDLGVAAMLLGAARAFERPEWEAEALTLARLAAARPVHATGVVDAGLCHGSAGLAHLFNRFYQATGEVVFREAALTWYTLTFELQRPGEGYAGFVTWHAADGEEGYWRGEAGFLTGIAGVGLALLAAVTEVEPAWDRVLLTAFPGR